MSAIKTAKPVPERITPHLEHGGPLASHLARYQFALPRCQDLDVLDAACGVGYGSALLASVARAVHGVDISDEAIEHARGHYATPRVRFDVMDVEALGLQDESFDVVCSFETIEHLENPERFVAEAARVLRPAGVLLLSTPKVWRTNHRPRNPHHRVELSRRALERLLGRSFRHVRLMGQRRRDQSLAHWALQTLDVLGLRSHLPARLVARAATAVGTTPWDAVSVGQFAIDERRAFMATETIAVCTVPRR